MILSVDMWHSISFACTLNLVRAWLILSSCSKGHGTGLWLCIVYGFFFVVEHPGKSVRTVFLHCSGDNVVAWGLFAAVEAKRCIRREWPYTKA